MWTFCPRAQVMTTTTTQAQAGHTLPLHFPPPVVCSLAGGAPKAPAPLAIGFSSTSHLAKAPQTHFSALTGSKQSSTKEVDNHGVLEESNQ